MTFVSDTPRPRILITHSDHHTAQEAPAAAPAGATFGNAILDSLGLVERHLLAPSLERVTLRVGECLEPPGQPVGYVYFPVEGLISMFAGATPGTRIEIATVGSDGMTGRGVLLGDMTAGEALVQAAGSAWRIAAGPLRQLAELNPALHRDLLAHVGVALRQIMDAVSHSGRATIVERLARWLSQAAQCLDSRRLVITHDTPGRDPGRPAAERHYEPAGAGRPASDPLDAARRRGARLAGPGRGCTALRPAGKQKVCLACNTSPSAALGPHATQEPAGALQCVA
jgi:CRP-like cAMP-binding protein